MFEWLISDAYKFEEVDFASRMSFLNPCAFHVKSHCEEHFVKSCAPFPKLLEYASPFCDSCQSSDHGTNSCPYVIFLASRLQQLEHEMKTCRESMENLIYALMDQFSLLVKRHVESTMPVLHETNLRIGPTISKGYLLVLIYLTL